MYVPCFTYTTLRREILSTFAAYLASYDMCKGGAQKERYGIFFGRVVSQHTKANTMSVYYWPPITLEQQQANAKARAAYNWENGGRQLDRCNAPVQMKMRARLRHQLQAVKDPDS